MTYRNGDTIPEVQDASVWDTLTTGAWCYYNNDSKLGRIYGKLYNRHAIEDRRGLAPVGWHVSTYADWQTLDSKADTHKATTLWNIPYPIGNESGLSALPGGLRDTLGIFRSIGSEGNWWTPDQRGQAFGGMHGGFNYNIVVQIQSGYGSISEQDIDYFLETIDYNEYGEAITKVAHYSTNFGFSIRCVKD